MTTIEIKRYEELQPAAIRAVLKNHVGEKGGLLPILHDVQHQLGYIPPSVVPAIAEAVNLSRAEVHGVISYYHDFHTEPQPRHRVQVCRAEACQARGGEDLLKHAKNSLGCNSKGVSRDGRFAVSAAYCLGLCASSPAMMLDEDVHARVSLDLFDRIVAGVEARA